MNKPNLRKILTALGHRVSMEFPYINHGGCCIFASLVAVELRRLGIEVKGVVGNNFRSLTNNVDDVRPQLKDNFKMEEWNKHGVYFNHIWLEIPITGHTMFYDAGHLTPPARDSESWEWYYVSPGRLTVDEMVELAKDKGWNSTFDRRQIPHLEQMIKAAFANV